MNIEKACFLDRDGVLIKEVNYLSSPNQVQIFPESVKALKILQKYQYRVIVVTNQAGVARGYFKESSVSKVHKEIDRQLLRYGLKIDAYYYCPHHPDGTVREYSINCNCRKPMPGMILKAAQDFRLDLSKSFLLGDKMSDLLAAENAGCVGGLVETGYGKEYKEKALSKGFSVFTNIELAVKFFIKN